ncbi:hypothetical protein PEP31012_03699 [Pandoraea eparura]|uniref:Uncharacterized protein n=2 Tax=Pandoraea eparura TaxID=2508291 RepID=A0A5E4X5P4_9BURK|nr:hypothetical protein PEP31012_03699 [Pandoraea eparura]
MDQSNEVQPVVTDADVGEQGNVPGMSSTDTTTAAIAQSTLDAGSNSSDGLATTNSGEAAISTDQKAGTLMRLHAAIDALEAKIGSGVHVFAHEVAAVREMVKAAI